MIDVDEFLEHHGVKGQKWGQRRRQASIAREKRYKAGTQTLRDKIIRDADLDPLHRRDPASTKKRVAMGAVAAALILKGAHDIPFKDLKF